MLKCMYFQQCGCQLSQHLGNQYTELVMTSLKLQETGHSCDDNLFRGRQLLYQHSLGMQAIATLYL